jgi:hypothetical protein
MLYVKEASNEASAYIQVSYYTFLSLEFKTKRTLLRLMKTVDYVNRQSPTQPVGSMWECERGTNMERWLRGKAFPVRNAWLL